MKSGRIRAFIFLLCFGTMMSSAGAANINVMMPLNPITDWGLFRRQLKTLKDSGVWGVTTDVWWGSVEAAGDNQFDWDYYRRYAEVVRESGLKWTPILSFHQCGGNIGDDCNIPLPRWVWSLGDPEDMIYRDRNGHPDSEYIAPWFSGAYTQYAEVMDSFAENFRDYQNNIPKVYISMGPAGELRFPSYNGAAGWHYSEPGSLQAYSRGAIQDLRERLRAKYGNNVASLNSAWNATLGSFEDIQPPRDGDNFFINGVKTPYGRDLMEWYQASLLRHLDLMKGLANQYLLPKLPVAIGAKISGVHWQYMSPEMPHAAEYAAGYMDYDTIVREFARQKMELTFTCLEMDDQPGYPHYSSPQGLVQEISTLANRHGVKINGENALPIVRNRRAYENIQRNLNAYHYNGFTLLRLQNVVDGAGRETEDLGLFRDLVIRNQGFMSLPFPGEAEEARDPFFGIFQ
jgi:beta-amylase